MSTSAAQINDLIDGYTSLKGFFEGERDRWNAVREAALNSGTFNHYVDAINGNDATGTGALAAPFRSLQAAIDAAPTAADLTIRLLTDYQVDAIINCPRSGRFQVTSSKAGGDAVITFANEATNAPGAAPHFDFSIYADVAITFVGCDIRLREFLSSHVNKQVVSRRAQTNVHFLNCSITALANCNQSFLGTGSGFGISFAGGTHTDMAGHWVDGVAGGTDPLTVRQCAFSTLATL